MEAPGPCNSPHSVSNRNLLPYVTKDTSPPNYPLLILAPAQKNGLARVKSDNSLEQQMSNNQKLMQDNLSVGAGSCKESHIFPSMAVELCIKVSTS